MFRTSLANATAQRTCKPLYEQHQATPVATFLAAADVGNVYSGMVATKSGADEVRICDGAADDAFGLFALDSNSVINDLDGQDQRIFAVWQGGPDAYFVIDAPAFDTSQSYTLVDGESVPLYAGTGAAKGKLTSANPGGNAQPVAQLIEKVSDTRIIVRLFAPASVA
jgi:hypothetical protein